jgi:acetate---CoA ligase (ADP-forming) subunit beta
VAGAFSTLSEAESKALVAAHGIPVPPERVASSAADAARAADELGYPVVVKLCGEAIAHKTERGLVRLGISNGTDVEAAATELLAAARPDDGDVQVLVAPMLRGSRELIAGLNQDPQFGMTVMLGIGGILAESIADVSFRLVPIDRVDAREMIEDLAAQTLLGPFRGEPAVDRERVMDVLMALSQAAEQDTSIVSVDLNPLIVVDGVPIAADALVEVRR